MKPLLATLLAPVFFTSCNILEPVEDASVYHLLTATVPDRRVTGSTPSVGIASPALPGYLDRQQLVSRTGEGVLGVNSRHQWAESLDAGIARVTAENLGRLENSLNIQPVKNYVTLDYESLLEIRVDRFEPSADNVLVLECTWKLQPVNGPVAPTRSFSTRIPLPPEPPAGEPGTGLDAAANPLTPRIQAMNVALARLAGEISRSL